MKSPKWILKSLSMIVFYLLVSSCATPYRSGGISGGYGESKLREEIWRVEFKGNGFTTYETVQTYWLYRCAELTLQEGYQGFQIVSGVRLVESPVLKELGIPEVPQYPRIAAAGTFVPIPYFYSPPSVQHVISGDIRVLRGPIIHSPPRVFDAAVLKEALEKYVKGEKCGSGNICPHVHEYVMQGGRLPPVPGPSPSTIGMPAIEPAKWPLVRLYALEEYLRRMMRSEEKEKSEKEDSSLIPRPFRE